ncbi:hypothetical protein GmHk_15G044716 [Glycine max]|nr:hypothetical protein GmHk_15G044716 [Glycine max]
MDEDQWIYDNIMSEEVNMNEENREQPGVFENIDCSNAFNTYKVFATHDDVLYWVRFIAYDISFGEVIMRSDTYTGNRGRTSYAKSLVEHPYVGRLTKDEKIIIGDMTKLKDENVVRVIFGSHPDAVKLTNACNLVFLIDSIYKTNRYMMSLLDIVGVTPTAMTFSATCVYFEGERIFLRRDTIPGVIVIDRDLTLMNAVKFFFPESTNLLCRFHINKNMKA